MHREDDADVRVMNTLRRLVSALRTSGESSRHMGMSVAQLFALRTIGQNGGLSLGELAERVLTTSSAVSEVVSRLVARGLVHRAFDASDHRRIQLHVTLEGRTLCDGLKRTVPEHLVEALRAMDPLAVSSLADAMESWVDAAGLGNSQPSLFGEDSRRDKRAVSLQQSI